MQTICSPTDCISNYLPAFFGWEAAKQRLHDWLSAGRPLKAPPAFQILHSRKSKVQQDHPAPEWVYVAKETTDIIFQLSQSTLEHVMALRTTIANSLLIGYMALRKVSTSFSKSKNLQQSSEDDRNRNMIVVRNWKKNHPMHTHAHTLCLSAPLWSTV